MWTHVDTIKNLFYNPVSKISHLSTVRPLTVIICNGEKSVNP